MRTIVITAADRKFFHMAKGAILSMQACPESAAVDFGIMDVGLDGDQCSWFAENGTAVAAPGWDLRHPDTDSLASHYKAFFSRPFLPRHFPGYDLYLWIDADAWVQDWRAVAIFIDTAKDGALAIATELDRAYPRHASGVTVRPTRRIGQRLSSVFYRHFRRAWGRQAANRYMLHPILNSGVFALRADAPHWQFWRDVYQEGLDRYYRRGWALLDQPVLNYIVYHCDLPHVPLPAWCNWLTFLALPMVDAETGLLVDPLPPHQPLGVIHNVAKIKDRRRSIATTDGKTVTRTLLYRDGDY